VARYLGLGLFVCSLRPAGKGLGVPLLSKFDDKKWSSWLHACSKPSSPHRVQPCSSLPTGGKQLVAQSYKDAKLKVDDQKEERAEKKAAKQAARDASEQGSLERDSDDDDAEEASSSIPRGGEPDA
jgi:hypothetical protein